MAPVCRAALLMLFVASASAARARKSLSASAAERRPTNAEWKSAGANATEAESAAAAISSKKAAVGKVVSMLESLQQKVLEEGEKEAHTYDKFSCFCKDTTAEKSEAIKVGMDKKAALSASISTLNSKRDGLDDTISGLLANIEQAEKDKKAARELRAKELAEYEKNSADLVAALQALEGAIKTLKASKAPSLAQLQSVAGTVRRATLIADALGLGGDSAQRFTALLQQAPGVPMEDYKYHSDKIIGTLETLLTDFRDEAATVDAEEVKAVAVHDAKVQELDFLLRRKNRELDDAKKSKEKTQDEIATASQELSLTSATLLEDQQYLKELAQMCSDKAKTWDQRSKTRQDELSALTAAIGIVEGYVAGNTSAATVRFAQRGASVRMAEAVARSPAAMEAVEAAAEEADDAAGVPPTLLQEALGRGPAEDRRAQEAVAELLRAQGSKLKSSLLASLASRVAGDPFLKVKRLIQDLIVKLQKEASSEATQKGFCDKSISEAEQKRDYAAKAIEELNGQMMELEARRDGLDEDVSVLTKEIGEIRRAVKEAESLRKEEAIENKQTVQEAAAGLQATSMAIELLYKFYKTVDDATVDLTLMQRGPAGDAPDAGFEIGEAYQGSQGEAGGILGMLEVVKSDFRRTMEVTVMEEARARKDYLVFNTKSGEALAEKTTARSEKTLHRDDAEQSRATAEQDLASESGKLQGALKELLNLKPACVDTAMTYEERVALRQNEIQSLLKAVCILDAYAQYGPGQTGEC